MMVIEGGEGRMMTGGVVVVMMIGHVIWTDNDTEMMTGVVTRTDLLIGMMTDHPVIRTDPDTEMITDLLVTWTDPDTETMTDLDTEMMTDHPVTKTDLGTEMMTEGGEMNQVKG